MRGASDQASTIYYNWRTKLQTTIIIAKHIVQWTFVVRVNKFKEVVKKLCPCDLSRNVAERNSKGRRTRARISVLE